MIINNSIHIIIQIKEKIIIKKSISKYKTENRENIYKDRSISYVIKNYKIYKKNCLKLILLRKKIIIKTKKK